MGHIKPMPDHKDWPKPDPNKYVFPPLYVRGIGRPKMNRKRDADESLKPNKKKRKCSKCKVEGHNAKTCKGLAAKKNDREKGKKKDRQAAPSQASATQVAASSQASATQVAAPSQAPTTQVAALLQALATQVAAPSQAPATQVATPSQATKLLASASTAATNLTFKPPPPPKRNIQAIRGFGQSMETFKPPSPPLATAVPRQKFKVVKDLGKL
ncbi:hypothetical protein IFM89_004866 [Coptis chinensis]|uniref:Uncharacterized protein n=1 Tax=Coptis chinensis TaxID=261450 RepID=A0A835M1K6_9MAGN|nr:hypothetical protein IFM89_004866 [Coptis chinensis]